MALTKIKSAGLSKPIDFADGEKIRLGTSNDLEIYHDGSNSYLEEDGVGQLIIRSWAPRIKAKYSPSSGHSTGEDALICLPDGAVELYYDNSKKLETISNGCTITGRLNVTDTVNPVQINLSDDRKIKFGDSDDLEIYHDGSSSYLHNNTGRLRLESDNYGVGMYKGAGSEYLAMFNVDGACQLYYDNSKKLETASNGIQLLDELGINDNKAAMFGNDDDMKIYHTGSNAIITNQTGDLSIQSDGNLKLERKDGGEDYIHCIANGAVELHHNGVVRAQTTVHGLQSDKFVHRTGTSSGTGMNEQESIWIGGGLNFFHDNVTLSTNQYTHGFANSRGYAMFRIRNNGGQAIYAESGSISSGSDYRMKENIAEITNGIEAVKKLKPSTYNIRKSFNPDDDGTKHHGFIAHEVQEAIPNISNIVSGTKDGMQKSEGNEGKPDYQGIDYGHLTPILAAAIKELITKVETLETKVS